MLFKKKKVLEENNLPVIYAERSSVCMGDDCNAPNPADLKYDDAQRLSDFVPVIAKYVPNIKNTWWEVVSDRKLLVTIYFDWRRKVTYKLNGANIKVADIPNGKIYCRYHY